MVENVDVGAPQDVALDAPQYVDPQFADATLARERVATATAAPLKIRDTIIHLYCYKSAGLAHISQSLAIRVPNWLSDSCQRRIYLASVLKNAAIIMAGLNSQFTDLMFQTGKLGDY